MLAVEPMMLSVPRVESYSVAQYSSPVVAVMDPTPCVRLTPTVKVEVDMPIGNEVTPAPDFSSLRLDFPFAV